MTLEIDESLCPFCHTENKCSALSSQQCWCFSVEVPKALQALVPEHKKRKACICQLCVDQFNKDPKEFISQRVD